MISLLQHFSKNQSQEINEHGARRRILRESGIKIYITDMKFFKGIQDIETQE